jgi:hypothetical protein
VTRLFTFGCSHTQWSYPTWADLLATGYDQFENWAMKGSGNRAIVERLSECILTNQITKDDTVIVQWTDFHRFDMHNPNMNWAGSWNCDGNLHKSVTTSEFVKDHWFEGSYMYHTYNFIHFAINMLGQLPCKWVMFSRNDLSQDLDQFPMLNCYKSLFDDIHWISPLRNYLEQINFKGINYKLTKKNIWGIEERDFVDDHPSPQIYANWLEDRLLPVLDVTINQQFVKDVVDIYNLASLAPMQEYRLFETVDWSKVGWHQHKNTVRGL